MNDRLGAALAPLLAAASGLALLASHPPVSWWPLTFLAPGLLVAALWTEAAAAGTAGRGVRAFRLGALMGLATFAPLLSWLIMPVGWVGWGLLVLVQAAWFGLLGALLRPVLQHASLPFAAAVAWTGVDAWRAVVPLNGFEWGAIAYAHVEGSWMLPVARLVGGRGITFLVVLTSVAAAVLIRRTWRIVRERDGGPVETALLGTRGPTAVLVGALLASVLLTIEPPPVTGSLDVLAVQGNDVRHWETPPESDAPLRIATRLRDLTVDAVARDGPPDLTVWPESSLDRDPLAARGAPLRDAADEAARAAGLLLTGATLDGPDPARTRFVTGLLLRDGFVEQDRYVKRRLVPFGEYIPLRPLLGWFPPLEQIPRDTLAADGPEAVDLGDGVTAAVVICFETLFTDVVRGNVLAGPEPADVLVVITNNASFGDGPAPAQHLAQTRLRAVETGRHAVHAALSGSSAFVAPDGTTRQETGLFEAITIRDELPLVTGRTPFLVVGDVVGWVTRVGAVALLGLLLVERRRTARTGAASLRPASAPVPTGPRRPAA